VKRFIIMTLAAVGILLGTVPVACAQNATCGTQTLSNTTIDGNLRVTGNPCTLGSDVTIGGNVLVAAGASLAILPTTSPVIIGGNILATNPECLWVSMEASSSGSVIINGNVAINCAASGVTSGYNGHGFIFQIGGNVVCSGVYAGCNLLLGSVGGNVEVQGNGSLSRVSVNTINGIVLVDENFVTQVLDNTVGGRGEVNGNGAGSSATGNTIGGNLTCMGNTAPFTGGPNTVNGQFLGTPAPQCF
jgi:hypothetical protein